MRVANARKPVGAEAGRAFVDANVLAYLTGRDRDEGARPSAGSA